MMRGQPPLALQIWQWRFAFLGSYRPTVGESYDCAKAAISLERSNVKFCARNWRELQHRVYRSSGETSRGPLSFILSLSSSWRWNLWNQNLSVSERDMEFDTESCKRGGGGRKGKKNREKTYVSTVCVLKPNKSMILWHL